MGEYHTTLMFLNPLGQLGGMSPAQNLSSPPAVGFVCQFSVLPHCPFLKGKNPRSQCSLSPEKWRFGRGWRTGVALGKWKVH